jgi:hypothetical protein
MVATIFIFFLYSFPIRFGRENFQEAMKISNRIDSGLIDWKKFKYMVFDIPNLPASYSERYSTLGSPQHYTTQHITRYNTTYNATQHIQPYIYHNTTQHIPVLLIVAVVEKVGGGVYQYVEVASKEECRDGEHLDEFCEGIMRQGGEGIILRDPTALYVPGRSPSFLKHKV